MSIYGNRVKRNRVMAVDVKHHQWFALQCWCHSSERYRTRTRTTDFPRYSYGFRSELV